ncbi:MAG: ABC transporter permease [Candidatus Bathyarchaeota archaeon]|nr:ABC transporter permease [Candidatus Bathyarchaeota archaeon]
MKSIDILGYSFSAIKLRKLRAGLTTLGVVIGIAAIVALLSITQGLQATITDQLNQGLSANSLIITAGSGGLGGAGAGLGGQTSGFKLHTNDTLAINELSPDIDVSLAMISRQGYIWVGDTNRSVTIYGVDYETYARVYGTTFVAENGTIPTNPNDTDLVAGYNLATAQETRGTVTAEPFNAGSNINIVWTNTSTLPPKNETYTAYVTATLPKIGGVGIGGPSDNSIYIPISHAENIFGTDECDLIIVQLKNSDNTTVTNVTKAITDYFGDQVTVISSTAVLSLLTSVFGTIQLFLGGIAAISLLVAGIGIMNIMIVSLIERTREIGILKALGMKSRTVLTIFLGESVIIGLMGAIIGIALGWGLALATAQVLGGGFIGGGTAAFAITPLLTPEVLLGALGFGIGVSVIFALYPAWRASKLKPVDALRYE